MKNKTADLFAQKRESSQKMKEILKASNPTIDKSKRIGTGQDGRIKLFYHGDSPKVFTGFGRAAREILGRLYQTGDYEIYSLGINDHGDTSTFEAPGITHFALPDMQRDPYGIHRFPELVQKVQPDVIFTLNDIFVLDGHERANTKGWFAKIQREVFPYTPWVFYFPVDSRPWNRDWASLAYSADKTIVYSKYAIEVLKEIVPEKDPVLIPHGVDLKNFSIIDNETRNKVREQMGAKEDTFLVGFINRNQPRKNPAATVEIFKMANDGYRKCNECQNIRILEDPKCEYCGSDNDNAVVYDAPLEHNGKLYMHCHMMDPMGVNLFKVGVDNNIGDSIIYRPAHNIAFGVPQDEFNALLNAIDVNLMPTMAEGFGLSLIETMQAGTISIATRSTAVTELLEDGRGYLITPKCHYIFDDAAHTRKHIIDTEKAVLALKDLYEDWKLRKENGGRWGPNTQKMVDNCKKFTEVNSWDVSAKKFDVEIRDAIKSRISFSEKFSDIDKNKDVRNQPRILIKKTGSAGDVLQTIPAIKKLKESLGDDSEICYMVPSNLVPTFQNRFPFIKEFLPNDRMSNKDKASKNFNLMKTDLDGAWERYVNGTYPYMERNQIEVYSLALKQKLDPEMSLANLWNLTDEEKENGLNILKDQLGIQSLENEFIVALCDYTEDRKSQWGPDNKNWNDLQKYLEKVGMKVYILDRQKRLVENLGAFYHCNMVITPESSILDFLHAISMPTLALISPFHENRVKDFDSCSTLYNSAYAASGAIDNPNPNAPSYYIDTIGVGEVFTKALKAFKSWKKAVDELKEKKDEVTNEV